MSNISLKLNKIINTKNRSSVKLMYGEVMCSFKDLVNTIWWQLTDSGKKTFLFSVVKTFIKLPKVNKNKYRVNITMRVELIGNLIVKNNEVKGTFKNEDLFMNYTYEVNFTDLKNILSKKLLVYNSFMEQSLSKADTIPALRDTEIIRFSSIVIEVGYKIVLRSK